MDRAFHTLPAGDPPSPLPSFRKSGIQGMRSAWAIGRLEIRHHVACLILSALKAGPWFEPVLSTIPPPRWLWWWCVQRSMRRKVTRASLLPSSISFSFYKWDGGGGGIAEHLLVPLYRPRGPQRKTTSPFHSFALPQQGASDEKQQDS